MYLHLLLLFQNEAVVFEAAVATAKNFHLIVPLIVTVQDGFDEVWLPVGDVKKEAIVFQNSLNLVLLDHALIESRNTSETSVPPSCIFRCSPKSLLEDSTGYRRS
jgi:hypothetical protein